MAHSLGARLRRGFQEQRRPSSIAFLVGRDRGGLAIERYFVPTMQRAIPGTRMMPSFSKTPTLEMA